MSGGGGAGVLRWLRLQLQLRRCRLLVFWVTYAQSLTCADDCSNRCCSAEADLPKLSSLGHFLKGSSAALGIVKVQASCEKMQHYGNCRDEEAGETLSEEEALRRIKGLLADCMTDYEVAKGWMKKLYEEE